MRHTPALKRYTHAPFHPPHHHQPHTCTHTNNPAQHTHPAGFTSNHVFSADITAHPYTSQTSPQSHQRGNALKTATTNTPITATTTHIDTNKGGGPGQEGGAGCARKRSTRRSPATHPHTSCACGWHSQRSRRHPQPPLHAPRIHTCRCAGRGPRTPRPHLPRHAGRARCMPKRPPDPPLKGHQGAAPAPYWGGACTPPTCLPASPAAAPPLAAGGNRKSPTPQPSPRPNFNTLHCCTFCAPQTHKLSQPQSHCHCWATSCRHAGRTAAGSHQYK